MNQSTETLPLVKAGTVSPAEVAGLFLKLGIIGFGGPAAHIAMMEDEVVRRRRWMSREDFLDLMGAVNLIPGPNSTELAIHIGHRAAGWPGFFLAGFCFITPAALIVACIAWSYVTFGTLPQADWILYGIKPVIIAVVLQAIWSLSRSAVKTMPLGALAVGALVLSVLGFNEIMLLGVAGGAWALKQWLSRPRDPGAGQALGIGFLPLLGLPVGAATAGPASAATASAPGVGVAATASAAGIAASAAAAGTAAAGAASVPFGLWPLFLFFVKVGSVLFGSGYILLAFLDGDLVERFSWLTRAQLLDAVAVGQITPGPLSTTATFIGYILGGPLGAAVATAGIFLPSFFFVAISGPLIPRIRRSPISAAALDGIIAASLGLMAAVTLQLARAALVDPITIILALVSAALLIKYKTNSAWLVGGGALAGLLIRGLG